VSSYCFNPIYALGFVAKGLRARKSIVYVTNHPDDDIRDHYSEDQMKR